MSLNSLIKFLLLGGNIGEMALYVNGKVSTKYGGFGLWYDGGLAKDVKGREAYIFISMEFIRYFVF